jgi:hypothetical protein
MSQTADEIRQEIDVSKQHLTQTMHQLEHRVEERIESLSDWRTTVKQYPFSTVLASFGAGFILYRICFRPALPGGVAETNSSPPVRAQHRSNVILSLLNPFGGTLSQRLLSYAMSYFKK